MPQYDFDSLGKEYGKPDLERLGIFVEMKYMNGTRYVSPFEKPKLHKGATFLPTGRKTKTGTQHGYFDLEFKRLFIGEGKGRQRNQKMKDLKLAPFITGFRSKKHATPGDYFGTLGGKIDAFSNVRHPIKPYKSPPINFITNNARKGGPGYANICLNQYPQHEGPDPYRLPEKYKQYGLQLGGPVIPIHWPQKYFDKNPYTEGEAPKDPYYIDRSKGMGVTLYGEFIPIGPAKWQGGSHAGCFDRFPEFMPCKYVSMLQATKPLIGDKGPVFYPQAMGIKTMFTSSVLQRNTDISVNCMNYKTYEPCYIKKICS